MVLCVRWMTQLAISCQLHFGGSVILGHLAGKDLQNMLFAAFNFDPDRFLVNSRWNYFVGLNLSTVFLGRSGWAFAWAKLRVAIEF